MKIGVLDDFSPFLNKDEFKRVYRPSDDSFFLLRSIKEDIASFLPQSIVVEIGCGSGFVIGNISKALHDQTNLFLAIDISFDACLLTQKFSNYYELDLQVINTDGLKGIKYFVLLNFFCLLNRIDVLIFNPPYVPTEPEELINAQDQAKKKQQQFIQLYKNGRRGNEIVEELINQNLIDSSYAGGVNGMEVIWKVIRQALPYLKKGGLMQCLIEFLRYILLVAENEIKDFVKFMLAEGFSYNLLGQQQKFNEIQFVFKQIFLFFRFKKLI